MYFNNEDSRKHLEKGTRLSLREPDETDYFKDLIVDRYLASGGISLIYLCHFEDQPARYYALKEFFPRMLEDTVVERRGSDGKIVFYNPVFEQVDNVSKESVDKNPLFQDAFESFKRESDIAERAASVYTNDGDAHQGSADILTVYGPLVSSDGNYYLLVDTYFGLSLGEFIDSGWESDTEKGKEPNSRIGEVLDLLADLTMNLTNIHGNKQILHLDLSPANVYLVKRSGGTSLQPYIIDWGSAYDRNNPNEKSDHRFSLNPFSAPEIRVLSEIQTQDAGYIPDETSDTYALVNILFYCVTGKVFDRSTLFNPEWKETIRVLYPHFIGEEAFAEELIHFFTQGLSPDQNKRYKTIGTGGSGRLYEAIISLRRRLEEEKPGRILKLVSDDDLQAWRILSQWPLYRYADNKEIHLLCLGSGTFNCNLIRSVLHIGQMGTDWSLHIHVLSNDPDWQDKIFKNMPEAEHYVEINGDFSKGVSGKPYAHFTFEKVEDLTDKELCQKAAEKYSNSRYVLISLGSNSANYKVAHLFADFMKTGENGRSVIHYYTAEELVAYAYEDNRGTTKPGVDVVPFGSHDPSFQSFIKQLGEQAFRVHDIYSRGLGKRSSRIKSLSDFVGTKNADIVETKYGQRSSAASAVHCAYTLASFDLLADPQKGMNRIIKSYNAALKDPEQRAELIELEHRRWLMFTLTEGYTFPTMEKLSQYSFQYDPDGKFNASFRSKAQKFHNCMVPCDTLGLKLAVIPRSEWDRFSSDEEIDHDNRFDPLEKISLKLHRYAGEMIRRKSTITHIEALLQEIEDQIGSCDPSSPQGESLLSAEESLRLQISALLKKTRNDLYHLDASAVSACRAAAEVLKETAKNAGFDIAGAVQRLMNALKIFDEFCRYHDYKASDDIIIEQLPWILWGKETDRVIRPISDDPAVNIAVPLALEPQEVIYLGTVDPREKEALTEFYSRHNSIAPPLFRDLDLADEEAVDSALAEYTRDGNCVIDVTGCTNQFLICAERAAENEKRIGVVALDNTRSVIQNVRNRENAGAYRVHEKVSTVEIFNLFGATEKGAESYMESIEASEPALWELYMKHRENWEAISAFFEKYGVSDDFYIQNLTVPADAKWQSFFDTKNDELFKESNLGTVLERLQGYNLIREYTLSPDGYGNVRVSFSFPVIDQGDKRNVLYGKFKILFDKCRPHPFRFGPTHISGGTYNNLRIQNRLTAYYSKDISFSFTDESGRTKDFNIKSQVLPFLQDLAKTGLIIPDGEFSCTNNKITISYHYAGPAVREYFSKAGNALEVHVWHVLRELQTLDDVRANFSFWWKDKKTSNELDVCATKNLRSMLISCKSAKMKTDHLTEIAYLASEFHSIPVIVYSSDKAVTDDGRITSDIGAVVSRARTSSNIHLFSLEDLKRPDFGRRLADLLN